MDASLDAPHVEPRTAVRDGGGHVGIRPGTGVGNAPVIAEFVVDGPASAAT